MHRNVPCGPFAAAAPQRKSAHMPHPAKADEYVGLRSMRGRPPSKVMAASDNGTVCSIRCFIRCAGTVNLRGKVNLVPARLSHFLRPQRRQDREFKRRHTDAFPLAAGA